MNDLQNDDQNKHIGKRIREERKRRGLTLQEIAEKIGLSAPYLSQIENGHVNINISTLESIAHAFETPLINFFVNGNSPEISVVRKSERRWFELGTKSAESLLVKSRSNLEIFVIHLEPDGDSVQDSSHLGEEFSYIIKGKIRIVLDHRHVYDLSEGDMIYYKSDIPHHWQNIGDNIAEILVANTPATY